jgi:hypothetical protein
VSPPLSTSFLTYITLPSNHFKSLVLHQKRNPALFYRILQRNTAQSTPCLSLLAFPQDSDYSNLAICLISRSPAKEASSRYTKSFSLSTQPSSSVVFRAISRCVMVVTIQSNDADDPTRRALKPPSTYQKTSPSSSRYVSCTYTLAISVETIEKCQD